MSQQTAQLFRTFTDEQVQAFVRQQQGVADDRQRQASIAQRAADAGRKELKRRRRGKSDVAN